MDTERIPQAHQPETVGNTELQSEHLHISTSPSGNNNDIAGTDTRPQNTSSEQPAPNPLHSQSSSLEPASAPRHPRGRDGHVRVSSQWQTLASDVGLPTVTQDASRIDWTAPLDEKSSMRRTVGDRLQPTIDNAVIERDKYARKALLTGHAFNIAIGLQVLLGALTTGISAAVTTAKQAQISTAVLGGLSTLVASYIARARGSGEPELSITRTKDLEQFLRESRAFQLDHAHEYPTPDNGLGERLENLRRKFEELLGNASGRRKLSPVGITPTQGTTD